MTLRKKGIKTLAVLLIKLLSEIMSLDLLAKNKMNTFEP